MENKLDDWNSWSKYVLMELERLNKCYKGLDKKVDDIRMDIVALKVKAGLWGALGGALPVLVALGIWVLQKG